MFEYEIKLDYQQLWFMLKSRKFPIRITEYPEMEGVAF